MGLYPVNVTDVYDTSEWSQTQTFIVPEPSLLTPELGNTILGVAITVAVIGVGLGLLLYLIRRK